MADPEPKRCLGCGYILEHLPEPRCPECGRGFDPADRRTYGPAVLSGLRYLWFALAGLGTLPLAYVAVALVPTVSRRYQDSMARLLMIAILVSVCLSVYVLVAGAALSRKPAHRVRHRGALLLGVAIAVLTLLVTPWNCVLWSIVDGSPL